MKRPLFSLPDHTVRSHPQIDGKHSDPLSYHGIVLIWEVVVAWSSLLLRNKRGKIHEYCTKFFHIQVIRYWPLTLQVIVSREEDDKTMLYYRPYISKTV